MMSIQLDIFEVGLGASILLHFKTKSETVRVLADAGSTRYLPCHVHEKLRRAIDSEADGLSIDLIAGTHYDADHLNGLVPIINDENISIGEAWLPPVANDVEAKAKEDRPLDSRLLALQFADDNGSEVLAQYLKEKMRLCWSLAEAEYLADRYLQREERRYLQRDERSVATATPFESDGNIGVAELEFHIRDANATLGVGRMLHHADDDVVEFLDPDELPYERFLGIRSPRELVESLSMMGRVDVAARSLAYIRRSAAKDAINAASLAEVVWALKARDIRIRCATIEDGQPRRFVWSSAERRFIPFQRADRGRPELVLLGPSEGLVKKHWDRLPIGDYMARLNLQVLPIKSMTPSNELSYVMRFDFLSQSILITGDSGFVDFKERRSKTYYPLLLEELSPLHVVQVAHHGGTNGHFYRGLLASGYSKQSEKCYLLLSHDVDDKHRPSELFGKFVERVRTEDKNLGVLFTSRPKEKFVRDFLDLVEPVVGSKPADCGDVQLKYDSGGWRVTKHSVEI